MLTVRTPASTANLGSGFDCLGLSLPLATTLRLWPAPETEIKPLGDLLRGTPAGPDNYVYQAMEVVASAAEMPLPPYTLR